MNWMFVILALIISLLLVADAKHAGSAYEAESANAETNKVPQRYVATKGSLPQTEAPLLPALDARWRAWLENVEKD